MKIASADDAAGPPNVLILQKKCALETGNLKKDDRPFPPRELTALGDNTLSDENGYYFPTGYFHPNTRPLKSCLSSSNISSMNRIESAPSLSSVSSMRRNVSFHKVEIREYERAVGDHPCATGGTSLSLGWKYNPDHAVVDFEPYEKERLKRSTSASLLPVPGAERKRILVEEANATQEELLKALREIVAIRGQRRRTNKLHKEKSSEKLEKLEEGFQSAKRKIRRFLSGTTKSKEERKLWKNAEKALQKRTAFQKIEPKEDMKQSSSSDNLCSDKLPAAHVALSSGWSMTKIPSFAGPEAKNSLTNEVASTSVSEDELSSSNDWEFSFDDRN